MAGLNLWEIYATLGVDTSQYDRDMDAAIAKAQTLNNTLNQAVGGGTTTGAGSSSTVPASTKGSWQDTTTGILMAEAVKKGAEWGWKLTKESINLASAKQEVQNVVDTTFGTYSDALDQWASGAKESFGVGEVSAKQYAGLFGDMLASAGFAGDELYTMSTSLTKLVGDIASFRNEDFDTAFTRVYSGMVGETEAIRRYGVNMTVANMEDYSGLDWDKASAQEQTRARYDYIMSHTTGAQGDFARTLDDSLANQRRLWSETWTELKTEWGEDWLGTITNVFSGLNELFGYNAPTLGSTLKSYDEAAALTASKAEQTVRDAEVILGVMDQLEAQGRNRADDPLWSQSLTRLSELMPGLSEHIDLTNGTLDVTTDTLREQAAAWKEDALAAGEAAAQLGKINALSEAENKLANKQLDMAAAQDKQAQAQKDAIEAAQAVSDALSDNWVGASFAGDRFDGTIEGAQRLMETYEKNKGLLSFAGAGLTEEEETQYQALKDAIAAYTQAATETTALETEITELTTQIDAGKESLAAYVETMNSTVEATSTAVAGLDQSGEAYQAGYATGTSYASGLSAGLANVPTIDVVSGASPTVDGSHAGGLEYVPYDGYIAELHRGERVQTAAEARQERGSEVNVNDLRDAIVGAIQDGMRNISITMNDKEVGRMVAPVVSREIAKEAQKHRYGAHR
ncbi:MAG: hypothetical protein IJX84_08615 [Clostridia bacterium]|nr:hypothetical protein [Clostridia bacterium]